LTDDSRDRCVHDTALAVQTLIRAICSRRGRLQRLIETTDVTPAQAGLQVDGRDLRLYE